MKLPHSAHTSQPWRIHEVTRGFRLEDVWALPTPGGPDDFLHLVQVLASGGLSRSSSGLAGALWSIRWRLGELWGWDDAQTGLGSRVTPLRDRLPADLRAAPPGPSFDDLPFTPLYLTDHEWAAEIANRTVHGVLHVGWVPVPDGGFRGQMAVLVKPNGALGSAYLAAIKPLRHLVVYPSLLRSIEQAWRRETVDRERVPLVREISLPSTARAHSTLPRIDYEDAFLVDASPSDDRTPEQWARVMLEEAPPAMRRTLRRAWLSLGMVLGPERADGHVLGWEVRRSTPVLVLLGCGSRIGLPGELLLERCGETLLFATFVRQQNPVVRALWARVAPRHRKVVRHLLERAAASPTQVSEKQTGSHG